MRDFLIFGAGVLVGVVIAAFVVSEEVACAQTMQVENGVTVIRGNTTSTTHNDAIPVIRGNEIKTGPVTEENGVTVIRGNKANNDYVTEENGVTVIRGDKK